MNMTFHGRLRGDTQRRAFRKKRRMKEKTRDEEDLSWLDVYCLRVGQYWLSHTFQAFLSLMDGFVVHRATLIGFMTFTHGLWVEDRTLIVLASVAEAPRRK